MSARDVILARISKAKGSANPHPGSGPTPQRGQVDNDEQRALFIRLAQAASATLDVAETARAVPGLIARYLAGRNLPSALRVSPDPQVANLNWGDQPLLEISIGPSDGTHPVSVTPAFAGIAETGTVALISTHDRPTTLNFLPETHIAILRARDLVGTYEALWSKLRKESGEHWPRTLNLITGPSRSADIEQTLLMGAHGPRRLHIILVDE